MLRELVMLGASTSKLMSQWEELRHLAVGEAQLMALKLGPVMDVGMAEGEIMNGCILCRHFCCLGRV